MEGGDNAVGSANNDVGVGGGASSGAAADPSTPGDGAAAAAGGGGVLDNITPVVEDLEWFDSHNTDGSLREWHTGHGEDCQDYSC